MRVTYFVLEQGQHSYSCSLVPRPTSSFDCLQCVKQIMASYPGPGYNSPIPTIAFPPPPQYLPMQKYWCSVLIQTLISGHVQGIFIQNQLVTKYGTPKIEYCWEHKQWLVPPKWEILNNHTLHYNWGQAKEGTGGTEHELTITRLRECPAQWV